MLPDRPPRPAPECITIGSAQLWHGDCRDRRSARHCPENTGYPRRILLRWEPIYLAAHWPGRAVCA